MSGRKSRAGTCSLCKVETVRRRATAAAPVRYQAGGLVGVLLSGIPAERCPLCGTETADPPAQRSLHAAIADGLVRRPGRLGGHQLRFLRTNARLAAGRFAALLGVDPAHLSRVENGKVESLGVPADRLARVLTAVTGSRRALREMIEELAGAETAGPDPLPLAFRWVQGKGWIPTG